MSDEVIAAVILSAGSLFVAIIGAIAAIYGARLTYKAKAKTDVVHAQVKNSHETNLREDIDQIKDALITLQDLFAKRVVLHDNTHERMWQHINKKENRKQP